MNVCNGSACRKCCWAVGGRVCHRVQWRSHRLFLNEVMQLLLTISTPSNLLLGLQ